MTVSTETRAYLQELEAHYATAGHDGTDHTHRPQPPTADIAFDAAAATAKVLALLIGDRENGVLPTDLEPTPEFQLAAAESIERYSPHQPTEEENR
jgi:hypothetical protein